MCTWNRHALATPVGPASHEADSDEESEDDNQSNISPPGIHYNEDWSELRVGQSLKFGYASNGAGGNLTIRNVIVKKLKVKVKHGPGMRAMVQIVT